MAFCHKCKTELTTENWYPSYRGHYKICMKCDKKRKHKYYLKHKDVIRRKNDLWYQTNKQRSVEYKRRWYDAHKKEHLVQAQEWSNCHPKEKREQSKRHTKKLKMDVINHYSNGSMACANPYDEHKEPYTTTDALQIDHINGGGSKHLKSLHGSIYQWLKNNNYPKGYQVLCANCNWIKRRINNEL